MTAKVFFVLFGEGHLRLRPIIFQKIRKTTNLACTAHRHTDLKASRTALAVFSP
jgi:hypothetical protein